MISTLTPAFIGNLRGLEWIIIIILALLLFGGAHRISKTMKSIGKGVHAFKQGLEDAKTEINKPVSTTSTETSAKDTKANGDNAAEKPIEPTAKAKDTDL